MNSLAISNWARMRSRRHRLSIRMRSEAAALRTRWQRPHLGILGCYNTSNVGDLALGVAVLRVARGQGTEATAYSFGLLQKSRPPMVAVAGGGGILTTHPTSPLRELVRYHEHCPVAALIGLSGKVEASELDADLQRFLEDVPFISLRSREDVEALRRLIGRDDIAYYPDAAFALGNAAAVRQEPVSGHRTLGVNVCPQLMTLAGERYRAQSEPSEWFRIHCADEVPFYSRIGPSYVQVMRDAVQSYLDRGWNVASIPFACEDDLFARFVFDGMAVRHQAYTESPQRVLETVARCDAMIATRFHAHVFALASGTPLLSVAYANKVESLWRDLNMPSMSMIRRLDIARNQAGALELLATADFATLPSVQRRRVVAEAHAGIEAGLARAA